MINPVVAIDGPSASGKGTVGRMLAQKIHFIYIDTGAMYRAFAWQALETTIDPASRIQVKKLIEQTKFETLLENQRMALRLNNIDPEPFLRTPEVNALVSPISQIPELREFLTHKQRRLRLQAPLVMEGRDIGTVVAPDTPYKFFLDADPAVRERRRREQGQVDPLAQRDANDSQRVAAPMMRAADADYIDSSNHTPEEIVNQIYARLIQKGLKPHVI